MPSPENIVGYFKEVGGVFKFGSGVLGKSAIAIGILMFAVIVAVWRLHSEWAILGSLGIGAVAFLIWFLFVLNFCERYPDVALLEGAEWSKYKRFQDLGTEKKIYTEEEMARLAGKPNPKQLESGE